MHLTTTKRVVPSPSPSSDSTSAPPLDRQVTLSGTVVGANRGLVRLQIFKKPVEGRWAKVRYRIVSVGANGNYRETVDKLGPGTYAAFAQFLGNSSLRGSWARPRLLSFNR
jgi:hypothetical protein